MNKTNFIYDLVQSNKNKMRYTLFTSAGIFNGKVEFPNPDSRYQDISACELIRIKNGYLQQGDSRINVDDAYVFLDSVVSISPATES